MDAVDLIQPKVSAGSALDVFSPRMIYERSENAYENRAVKKNEKHVLG